MATFSENLNKIRGDAVYGREVRTAIADAISQSINVSIEEIPVPIPGDQRAYIILEPTGQPDDYTLKFYRT